MKDRVVAIVLSAGKGKRMGTDVAKQYLLIKEKPILYYTLKAFEESNIDEVYLVVAPGEETVVTAEIIKKYDLKKVVQVIAGGENRYDSVYEGLRSINDVDYVLIHDGARPCLSVELINRMIHEVIVKKACVASVLLKDTVKRVDTKEVVVETPNREELRCIQTPQAFAYSKIRNAYDLLMQREHSNVTDDAMVIETVLKENVYCVNGEYTNIKVTTPEDLALAECFLFH